MKPDKLPTVDQCSLYSVFIEAIATDKKDGVSDAASASATGFIYQYKGNDYLVSNCHVFSGRHSIDLTELDETNLSLPDKIKVHFPHEGKQGTIIKKEYSLKDSSHKYCWLEHPLQNTIDVAVLPIKNVPNSAIYPINQVNESRGIKDFPSDFYVGQEVFVLGFPLGLKGSGAFPIWKKASIATEPYLPLNGESQKILIDTATRKGMSGSPVMVVGTPGSEVLFDGKEQPINFRSFKFFLGVYSGRITGSDELAAQLGIVWKEQVIKEIIEANRCYIDPKQ